MLSMSAYYVVKHAPTGDCFIVLKEVADRRGGFLQYGRNGE